VKQYCVRSYGGFKTPYDVLLRQLERAMNEAARHGWHPLHVVSESPSALYTVVFERERP
jgi:hypothetical protein